MKQFFTIILALVAFSVSAQETYEAKKATGTNVPVIDGTIESLWSSVDMVDLTKVPEKDGAIHTNITVPDPEPADYSASVGFLWNEDGLYVIFKVIDDVITIVDDYDVNNTTPADQWWTDDNINLLFSKDLVNNSFSQFEFAWQPGIDQEEKLSSDDWLNAAVIDISLVESAWSQDGDEWTLETFINWDAFEGGKAGITEGMEIQLEARARDDDDIDGWESMYQWSTINYGVESDGVGMGVVTLSATAFDPPAVSAAATLATGLTIAPNPASATVELSNLPFATGVITVVDAQGKTVLESAYAAEATTTLDVTALPAGLYSILIAGEGELVSSKLIVE